MICVLIGIILLFILLSAAFKLWAYDYFDFKTDSEMSTFFQQHKESFDQLISSINSEHFEGMILPDGQESDRHMPDAKLKESQKIIHDLGAHTFIIVRQDEKGPYIDFPIWGFGQGISCGGPIKGYLYTKEKPIDIVNNLDDFARRGFFEVTYKDKDGFWTRHLDGDWYIYYYLDNSLNKS